MRNFFAFLALPAVLASGYTCAAWLIKFSQQINQIYMPFLFGILAYYILHVSFAKPMCTYIFGHELSHAIAGLLSGAKIKKFRVGKQSGSVTLTKNNIWITLAPYLIPLYSFIVIIVYFILGYFIEPFKLYPYFLFCFGLTISFHIALTFYVIKIGQSDLRIYGTFFSCVLIVFINILVFDLMFSIAFANEISFLDIIIETINNIKSVYLHIFRVISSIFK
jgi:hypothetical protein